MSFKINNYVATATDLYNLSKEPITGVLPLTEKVAGALPGVCACGTMGP